MSTRSLMAFALGCALGFGIAFVALRSDRAQSPTFAVARSDPQAPSDEQIGPRVTEILNGEDALRRVAELSALLSTLGPTAVPALVEAFEAAPLDRGDPELVLLGMWWVRLDPQAALAWATSEWRAQSGTVIAAVFRSWAHTDPKASLGAARGLAFYSQKQLAEIAVDAAIFGWDESGQPGLVEAITQFPDLDLQRFADSLARRRVVKLGPVGAFRWVESLEATPRFQQVLAERVASAAALSAEGAPLAAAWATPRVRSDDRLSNFPRRIATRWVAHDPEAAMAWLATLPAGADRSDGVTEAFRDWMSYDRQAASAWIEKIELQPWNEPALGLYARAIASERPKEAIELAQRISDPQLRETTMVVISRLWISEDRAAAEAWLAQPGVPERVRRASARVGGNDPRASASGARAERSAMTGAVPDVPDQQEP
jgi:hypothetical protein